MKNLPVKDGEAYLFEDRLLRRYVAETDVAEGFFLYDKSPVYFTDMRYYFAAKKKLEKAGVNAAVFRTEQDIADAIRARNIKTLLIDFSRTTVTRYNEYGKFAEDIKDCSSLLNGMRAVKSEAEIKNISLVYDHHNPLLKSMDYQYMLPIFFLL